ncbi:MAG: GTP 3',8-cyclase MoaA [Vallitaleaceae bacterium]|nr:GTP 3',8-cyclase MoaA [Vallitaleaceae bacterium]
MLDKQGRNVDYIRISVTRDCNLKCLYCNSDGCIKEQDHSQRLTPQDYKQIVSVSAELGIKKVRITGGEPLMRPDICDIISAISSIKGIMDIALTTNGVLLAQMAQRLLDAGLTRVNVSLDSMKEETFEYIAGVNKLKNVLNGIHKALEVGLIPVKINTVLIKGINDAEIDDFIQLTKEMPVDVRFIELMPIGKFGEENRDKMVLNSDILTSHSGLMAVDMGSSSQPAAYYTINGHKGRVGFISPISHMFCERCNRIRLTNDGKLKPCLGNNQEIDLRAALKDPNMLRDLIGKAILDKPCKHEFNKKFVSQRDMSEIGG